MRKAVYDAEEWMYNYRKYLSMMNIELDNEFVCFSPTERRDYTESAEYVDVAAADETGPGVSDMELVPPQEEDSSGEDIVMDEIALTRIVHAASHVKVSFPQLRF